MHSHTFLTLPFITVHSDSTRHSLHPSPGSNKSRWEIQRQRSRGHALQEHKTKTRLGRGDRQLVGAAKKDRGVVAVEINGCGARRMNDVFELTPQGRIATRRMGERAAGNANFIQLACNASVITHLLTHAVTTTSTTRMKRRRGVRERAVSTECFVQTQSHSFWIGKIPAVGHRRAH